MILLDTPFDRAAVARGGLPWAACAQIAVPTLAVMVAGLALAHRGGALVGIGHALAGGAAHAAMLGIGWVLIVEGRSGWQAPVIRLTALVLAASMLGHATPWGAIAYLLVPPLLIVEARGQREISGAGLQRPTALAAILGLLGGAFLGVHLLITSSLTFGYPVRIGAVSEYLGAASYDVGLSALTAEWLFRGALFSAWWRRWAFASAATLSSAMAVIRYVVDPNLPPAVEVWLGAAFYTGLLGATACALRAWSGSLVPGYLATAMFFLAYRSLGH